MSTYALSIGSNPPGEGAEYAGSTAAVALTGGVLSTLASSHPGWRMFVRGADAGATFSAWRYPDSDANGSTERPGGRFNWHGVVGQMIAAGGSATLTVSTLTSIAPSVGDLLLVDDGTGHWVPTTVTAITA